MRMDTALRDSTQVVLLPKHTRVKGHAVAAPWLHRPSTCKCRIGVRVRVRVILHRPSPCKYEGQRAVCPEVTDHGVSCHYCIAVPATKVAEGYRYSLACVPLVLSCARLDPLALSVNPTLAMTPTANLNAAPALASASALALAKLAHEACARMRQLHS